MELNNKNETYDGMEWKFPKCLNCKFCDGKMCNKYQAERIDLPIDLFECPGFEKDGK